MSESESSCIICFNKKVELKCINCNCFWHTKCLEDYINNHDWNQCPHCKNQLIVKEINGNLVYYHVNNWSRLVLNVEHNEIVDDNDVREQVNINLNQNEVVPTNNDNEANDIQEEQDDINLNQNEVVPTNNDNEANSIQSSIEEEINQDDQTNINNSEERDIKMAGR